MTLLEFARRQRRWSQQRLSDETGGTVHQHAISMFETLRGNPTALESAVLAGVLNLPADRLQQPVPDLSEVVAAAEAR